LLLKGYKGREGHCDVPNNYKENGFSLGAWVASQRQNKIKNRLPPEQRGRLDQLGFVWTALKDRWEQGCSISHFIGSARGIAAFPPNHKEGDLRRQSLDVLGFVWNVRKRTAADSSVKPQELES